MRNDIITPAAPTDDSVHVCVLSHALPATSDRMFLQAEKPRWLRLRGSWTCFGVTLAHMSDPAE